MNAAEEQGRRATAQLFYNYQQWLHKQHCSFHSPGETVTSGTAATAAAQGREGNCSHP